MIDFYKFKLGKKKLQMLLLIPESSVFLKKVTINFETYTFDHKIGQNYPETVKGIICELK